MIDRLVFDAGKSFGCTTELVNNYTFENDYSLNLSDLKPEIVKQFLTQNVCFVSTLSADPAIKNRINQICEKTLELQQKYTVFLCLSYGKILDTPLLLQKCIIDKVNGEFTLKLDHEIVLKRNFARLMGISEKLRTHRTNNIFRASDAISAFNNSLAQHGKLYNLKQYSKHYNNTQLHNFDAECGTIEFEDSRILSIFLDDEILSEKCFLSDCENRRYINSPIIQTLDSKSKIGQDFTVKNVFENVETFENIEQLNQIKDATPDSEFGLGDLSNVERAILREYDCGKSFIIKNAKNIKNLKSALLTQSACKGEKVIYISDENNNSNYNVYEELNKNDLNSLYINLSMCPQYYSNFYKKVEFDWNNAQFKNLEINFNSEVDFTNVASQLTEIYDNFDKIVTPWQISLTDIAFNALSNYDLSHIKQFLDRDTCLQIMNKIDIYANEISNYTLASNLFDDELKIMLNAVDLKNCEAVDYKQIAQLWDNFGNNNENFNQNTDVDIFSLVNVENIIDLSEKVKHICTELKIKQPKTYREWLKLSNLFRNIMEIQDIFIRDIFSTELDPYIKILTPNAPKMSNDKKTETNFSVNQHKIGFFERNRLLKELQAFIRPTFASSLSNEELYLKLLKIIKTKEIWRDIHIDSNNNELLTQKFNIVLPTGTAKLLSLSEIVQLDIRSFERTFLTDFADLDFVEIYRITKTLLETKNVQFRIHNVKSISHSLSSVGILECAKFITNYVTNHISTDDELLEEIKRCFNYIWHQNVFEHIKLDNSQMIFDSSLIDNLITHYNTLNKTHLANLTIPIKYNVNNAREKIIKLFKDQTHQNSNNAKFNLIIANNDSLNAIIREFYNIFIVSSNCVGRINKFGFDSKNRCNTLVVDIADNIKLWKLLPLISISDQIIIISNENVNSETVLIDENDYQIGNVFSKTLPVIDYTKITQISDVTHDALSVNNAKNVEILDKMKPVFENNDLIVTLSSNGDFWVSEKSKTPEMHSLSQPIGKTVKVIFDFIKYQFDKSLRSNLRLDENVDYIHICIFDIINNPKLEFAKIKAKIGDSTLIQSAKPRINQDKSNAIDARGREMLENVPPHWS